VSNRESKDAADSASESIFASHPWLSNAALGILGALGLAVLGWLAPDKAQWTFPARIVLLTAGVIVLLFLFLGLFCHRLWQRTRKRVRFGVLWNGDRQPICAKCGGPLEVPNENSFWCPVCQLETGADGKDGLMMSTHEAIAKIRLRKYSIEIGRSPRLWVWRLTVKCNPFKLGSQPLSCALADKFPVLAWDALHL
jgi:hypothetical protein